MKRYASASFCALFGSACIALMAAPGCSGSGSGSGFGNNGNPNNNNKDDSGGMQGQFDGAPSNFDAGSFGPLTDGGGNLSPDASCATATAQASRQPVYMLFVLDGSGSMNQNNKWTAATAALSSIFMDFQTKADPSFGAGILVFSDQNDPSCSGGFGGCTGPYPTNVDVPIAYVDATQEGKLAGRINSSPSGDTPTHAALTGGYSELEAFTPSGTLKPGGKKVLVILTDGVPTDGSNSACIQAAGQELTKTAPAGPITTFVIGTGQFPSSDPANFDPTFLGQLAKAGGAAPTGCNPTENSNVANVCYFEVDPTTSNASQLTMQFEAAINTIRGQVASCTFALNASGGAIDPSKVNVIFTPSSGSPTELTQDPANGWTYNNPSNPTEVILNGTSCTNMKNDPMGKISIILGCATKTPK